MPQIKRKNLVVGAGFSGAVIAERLANILKEDVLVIDKNPYTGGVCHDYKDKTGITIQEFGSHIFHTNFEYIWKYINKFTKFTLSKTSNFPPRVALYILIPCFFVYTSAALYADPSYWAKPVASNSFSSWKWAYFSPDLFPPYEKSTPNR